MTYSLSGNGILAVTFANIYLPDSVSNEPMSHGLVTFSIKPKPGLALNTQLLNTASIIFDFNSPIVTNTTLNTIYENSPNGIPSFNKNDAFVQLYPNPTSNNITLQTNTELKNTSITLYDVTGKLIKQYNLKSFFKTNLDLSQLDNGIYFIEILHNGKSQMNKIIKQ
jgi:hypothetical protein